MSIYYELRMTGRLSFKKEDAISLKIKDFFKSLMEIEEKLRYNYPITLDLDREFILTNTTIENKYYGVINDWCPVTYNFRLVNHYIYAEDNECLLIKIREVETDIFEVDYCIGNKNAFGNLELLTLLLIEYMVDGFELVYYDESSTKKLKVKEDSLSNYIKENTCDEYCGYCSIFDTLEVLGNSVIDLSAEEEYESDWLRKGLFYYLN